MTESVTQTIQLVQEQVQSLEQQLVEKKRIVNSLCALIGQSPIYPDSALMPGSGLRPLRPDEYYGKGLASAIRMVLDRRETSNVGPASVAEIYDALVAGGYKFETKNEENAKRGLYNALAKNSVTFHRLPNGSWGLLAWYPNVRESKKKTDPEVAVEAAEMAVEADEPFNTDETAENAVAVGAGANGAPVVEEKKHGPRKPR